MKAGLTGYQLSDKGWGNVSRQGHEESEESGIKL